MRNPKSQDNLLEPSLKYGDHMMLFVNTNNGQLTEIMCQYIFSLDMRSIEGVSVFRNGCKNILFYKNYPYSIILLSNQHHS